MNNDMLIRVTRYYRALTRLRAIGLEKVFAHNLAVFSPNVKSEESE